MYDKGHFPNLFRLKNQNRTIHWRAHGEAHIRLKGFHQLRNLWEERRVAEGRGSHLDQRVCKLCWCNQSWAKWSIKTYKRSFNIVLFVPTAFKPVYTQNSMQVYFFGQHVHCTASFYQKKSPDENSFWFWKCCILTLYNKEWHSFTYLLQELQG